MILAADLACMPLTQVTQALASFVGVSSGASLREFKNFKQLKFDDYLLSVVIAVFS